MSGTTETTTAAARNLRGEEHGHRRPFIGVPAFQSNVVLVPHLISDPTILLRHQPRSFAETFRIALDGDFEGLVPSRYLAIGALTAPVRGR